MFKIVLSRLGFGCSTQRSSRVFGCARIACAVAILLAATVPGAYAQTATGDIHGTVSDSTDATIPAVSVTLTSTALLNPQTVTTEASGIYHFLQLNAGTYKMTFT